MSNGRWSRPLEWWWVDVPVAALLTSILAITVRPGTGIDLLGKLSLAVRREIYSDMLQLSTIFAGFGGVIFAVYLGLQSKRVRTLKDRVGKKLVSIWIAAILTPWLSAALIILATILDRGGVGSSNIARWLAVGAILVVASQIARVVWIFYQLAIIDINGDRPTVPIAARPARIRRRAS